MNTSHYHTVDGATEPVEMEGLPDHCDHCRKKAGKKPLSEMEQRLAQFGVATISDTGKGGAGSLDADDVMKMLEEQEEANDELRTKNKELSDEVARLKAQLAKGRGGGGQ